MKLTPRQVFRKQNKEAANSLSLALSEPWFHAAVSSALGEMAARGMLSSIPGANAFLETLHTLAEDDAEVKREPDPSLPSYGI